MTDYQPLTRKELTAKLEQAIQKARSSANPKLRAAAADLPSADLLVEALWNETAKDRQGRAIPGKNPDSSARGYCQMLTETARGVASEFGIPLSSDDDTLHEQVMDPDMNLLLYVAYTGKNWNLQPQQIKQADLDTRKAYSYLQHGFGDGGARYFFKQSLNDDRTFNAGKLIHVIATDPKGAALMAGASGNPQAVVDNYSRMFNTKTAQALASSGEKPIDRYINSTKSGYTGEAYNFSVDPNRFLENTQGVDYGTNERIAKLQAELQAGLEYLPWWEDDTLITSNPKLKADPDQMYFEVFTDRKYTTMLRDKSGDPIKVRMYVNIDKISERYGHTIGRGTTKTGFKLDLWGQELDEISGSGSTGLFMNSLGVTHLPSIARNSDLAQTLLDMYMAAYKVQRTTQEGQARGVQDTWTWVQSLKDKFTTNLQSKLLTNAENNYDATVRERLTSRYKQAGLNPTEYQEIINATTNRLKDQRFGKAKDLLRSGQDLRVGAQDAFVEMLMLFKNNGTTRFLPSDIRYTGVGGATRQKIGDATWSAKMGGTFAQENAKANDIQDQGGILFKRRNVTYIGVFKSFTFTMDAEKPFHWNYNFSFIVQKTLRITSLPWSNSL